MADLRTIIKGLDLRHPVLPGPGSNVAGAAEAMAAVDGGAPALVLQTVTCDPGGLADLSWAPYGKDGAFHRQPCTAVPFDTWIVTEFPPALEAARKAGVPCIPSIGYQHADVIDMGRRLAAAGADALIYDTAHTPRDEIGPVVASLKALVDVPIILTLAPHHGEDLSDLAVRLQPFTDAFLLIGAFGPVLALDVESVAASPGVGWLSGAPIRPIMQRFVFETARRVTKPVIAAGGITTGADVAEAVMLGASAVMISTAAVRQGPDRYGALAAELEQWLMDRGHLRIGEIYRSYIHKYGPGQRVVVEKEEAPQLIAADCITCTFCETVCFYDAIKAPPKTLPTIDPDPCFQCGLCVSACPTDALRFRPRDLATMLPEGG